MERRQRQAAEKGGGGVNEATVTWQATVTHNPLRIWLCIPALPPSLNVWSRKHWRIRHAQVKALTTNLLGLRLENGLPKVERPRVQLVYYFRDNRKRDPDNYAGKFILDGLRHAGIIADDNAGVLRLPQPEFQVDKQRPRTEVFVSEWSEERSAEK
jgi:crossover junction endodeoxyribonuclease RusA